MTIIIQSEEETELPATLERAWLRDLPDARRIELEGWPDTRARQRSLLGSRLLRAGLRQLGFPDDSLASLRYPPHGKPALDLPVHFSLSHCAGRVLCALSRSASVGVDIEPVGTINAAEFRRYLTAGERAWAGDDPRRFASLWTRKEAVVKAAGAQGLAQLHEVRIDGDDVSLAGSRWHTAPLPVDPGYAAHVAQAEPFAIPPQMQSCRMRPLRHGASMEKIN